VPQQGHVADRLDSGDEQQLSSLHRKRLDPTEEARLDLAGQRPGLASSETSGHLDGGQAARQLQQGQRIAARLGDDAVPHTLVERAGDDGVEEFAGLALVQSTYGKLRQVGEDLAGAGLADGQDEQNGFGEQSAGNEFQGLGRHPVQPLRVVDQTEQLLVADGPGEQTQGGQADQKPVGRITDLHPERRAQCVPLRLGKIIEMGQQRSAELVQPRVGELHLGLHAGRPDDAAAGSPVEKVSQQLGLPDPRLTAHHHDAALPGPGPREQVIENHALMPPTDEPGPCSVTRHGSLPAAAIPRHSTSVGLS
jgi:hypothetical protein